jgi:hypothetical protein
MLLIFFIVSICSLFFEFSVALVVFECHQVIDCLTSRCGTRFDTTIGKQLILEALLPHKEIIINLARKMLADSEASITALSSTIIKGIAWWP